MELCGVARLDRTLAQRAMSGRSQGAVVPGLACVGTTAPGPEEEASHALAAKK